MGGRIVETGGVELAKELFSEGYERIRRQYPDAAAANDANVAVEEEKELVG
jgi:Fe-S cluster assembly ATP-binding protein